MRSLGTIAVTIFGLFAITMAFALTASMGTMFFTYPFEGALPSALLFGAGIVGLGTFGYWLITQRHSLAAHLFPESDFSLGISALDLLRVALVVMGFSLVVSSVPNLIGHLGSLLQRMQPMSPLDLEMALPIRDIVWPAGINALELAAGIILVRRSEPVAMRLWERGRTGEETVSEST